MNENVYRREFLRQSAKMAIGGALIGAGQPLIGSPAAAMPQKAACIGVFPSEITVLQRFEMAKAAGFAGIEPNTLATLDDVQEYREAADKTGIKIHSIMNSGHWTYPLSDPNPEIVRKCVDGIETSLQNAHHLGADAVLLVPGVVTSGVRYVDVYKRSQEQIRKLIPVAKQLGVVIAVENVGNRFLLSPLEFCRYIDEFKSPWVKAYFDIGNIVSIGWPQDWIRTLGPRIHKVHIKRFEPGVDHPKYDLKDRRAQGIDWPDVRKALSEIGYNGWITAEVRSGDEKYVQELSARLDRIFAGQHPV